MTHSAYARTACRALALGACLSAIATPATALAAGASGGAGLSATSATTGTATTSTAAPSQSGAATTAAPGTTAGSTTGAGGAGAGSSYGNLSSPIAATPADLPVSASGNGVSIATNAAGTYRRTVTFTGLAPSRDAGELVAIQQSAPSRSWSNVARGTISADGTYRVRWQANKTGTLSFRALLTGAGAAGGQPTAAAASARAASPALKVTVFSDAIATIYGPGLYGNRTACGQRLTPETVGVASRTLRCGTQVEVYYHGQSVTVPVIDRGPFGHGASWDLTEATAQALGILETVTVGTATS